MSVVKRSLHFCLTSISVGRRMQIKARRYNIQCYSYIEVFAEKIRALSERTRPRDLYDVRSYALTAA